MKPLRVLALAVGCALLCAPAAAARVRLQQVGSFDSPVYVAAAPGDHSRLYVVEQAGTIRVVKDGSKLPVPFADLTGPVLAGGERGLLSVAFAPDFQRSRLLYVYYTADQPFGAIRVDELRAPTGDRADPGHRRRVIEVRHDEAGNHNGGLLQFGPDGHLYLGTGDGGNAYDVPVRDARDPRSLLGKLLRVDPTPGGGYRSPPDNPFAGAAPGADEVWSFGLRNPYRFSFDRPTGDLAIADVGQDTIEEVDFSPASSGRGRGAYYGWDDCEGSLQAEPATSGAPCTLSGDVRPVLELPQSAGYCSVIGGFVVRDPTLPSLSGRYLYGDLCRAGLRSALLRSPRALDDREVGVQVESLTSFGEDAAGCVYAASFRGPVYRLVERSTRVPCPDGRAPVLSARAPRRQNVRRRRGVVAYARCDEPCAVTMTARLRIGRRSYRLRSDRKDVLPGGRARLRVRLARRASRALRRARRRRGRVAVELRARDRAGNQARPVRRRVRVRG